MNSQAYIIWFVDKNVNEISQYSSLDESFQEIRQHHLIQNQISKFMETKSIIIIDPSDEAISMIRGKYNTCNR
jgi:hypothetical protein